MNAKEQWINKTMESLDGASRAVMNPLIREKILQGIHAPRQETDSVKFSLVCKIAAAVLLLISLNIFTLVYFNKASASKQDTTKSVAGEYFSYIDHYNL